MKLPVSFSADKEQCFSVPGSATDSITYRMQQFESTCFENTTLEILSWHTGSFSHALRALKEHLNLQPRDMIYMRLDATNIKRAQEAAAEGFFFVECSIVPTLKVRNWDEARFSRLIQVMDESSEQELSFVEAIASTAFKNLRFNLDGMVGDTKANRRYFQWLRNAYQSNEDVRVIRHKGEVAGFCLFKHDLENSRTVIRLAALREDLKGSGLGISLFASAVAYCKSLGVKQIDGGISMANTPVLNVMSTVGFIFRDPTVVLHYHV